MLSAMLDNTVSKDDLKKMIPKKMNLSQQQNFSQSIMNDLLESSFTAAPINKSMFV